ncbi:MAG: DUF1499 domain-containing protein [Proteobacteria bacterium]|nr:DUF1499 domain-containing protein [Pseudomonadota bacterium]
MTPLAWLIGFIWPACGFAGTGGLPPPTPMDMAHLQRPATPNAALAAPAGFVPAPDITTQTYPVPPGRLLAAIEKVAAAQPRTYLAGSFPDMRQVHYVARSALFNFPDLIAVQVDAVPPGAADARASSLVLFSRSVYGRSDLGVNRARLDTWLAALDTALGTSPGAATHQPAER